MMLVITVPRSGGLGQLMDGRIGHDNIDVDVSHHGKGNNPTAANVTRTHIRTHVVKDEESYEMMRNGIDLGSVKIKFGPLEL
jgi:hypothetical protein